MSPARVVGTRSPGAVVKGSPGGGGGGGGGGPTWDLFQTEAYSPQYQNMPDGSDATLPTLYGLPVLGPPDPVTSQRLMRRHYTASDPGVLPGYNTGYGVVNWHPATYNAARKGTAVAGIGAMYPPEDISLEAQNMWFGLYKDTDTTFTTPLAIIATNDKTWRISTPGFDGDDFVSGSWTPGHPYWIGYAVDLDAGTIHAWIGADQFGASIIHDVHDTGHLSPGDKLLPNLQQTQYRTTLSGFSAPWPLVPDGIDMYAYRTGGGGVGGGAGIPGAISAGKPKGGPVAVSKNIVGMQGSRAAL